MNIDIRLLNGSNCRIQVPSPGNAPSFFAFSLHKAGSTLLFNMIEDAMAVINFPVINLPKTLFANGEHEACVDASINSFFIEKGYAYTGWRFFPYYSQFDHNKVKNILLVRDPRDILVSLYFSVRYSHALPSSGMMVDWLNSHRANALNHNIESWLFREVGYSERVYKHFPELINYHINQYQELLPNAKTKIYKYEDVVFNKREWLADMLLYLNFNLPVDTINKIADKYDVFPETELPSEHIRQVLPGNYKKHLNDSTINRLNDYFSDILDRFGYSK